jgi:hypothetical protein
LVTQRDGPRHSGKSPHSLSCASNCAVYALNINGFCHAWSSVAPLSLSALALRSRSPLSLSALALRSRSPLSLFALALRSRSPLSLSALALRSRSPLSALRHHQLRVLYPYCQVWITAVRALKHDIEWFVENQMFGFGRLLFYFLILWCCGCSCLSFGVTL